MSVPNALAPRRAFLADGMRRYFLSTSGPTFIGASGCAILLNGPGIESRHARVVPTRAGFKLEALEGAVLLNHARLENGALLNTGDIVSISEFSLVFEGPSVPLAEQGQALSYEALYEKLSGCVVSLRRDTALGSAFFVHPSGLLVTNRHVVKYARQVEATLADGRKTIGQVMRSFPGLDLAFARLVDVNTPIVPPFVPPAMVRVGQSVLAIGHPMGLSNTLTRGIISAIDRSVSGNTYLQTDAAINPGNSGGPLFNEYGETVGVATFGVGHAQGLSFAIPAEVVRLQMEVFLTEEARIQSGRGVYCNVCGGYGLGGEYCSTCGVELGDETIARSLASLSSRLQVAART